MRMWGIAPSMLCRSHLLGEHFEMHKFVGAIKNGKSISGFLSKGFVEIHKIGSRHSALAKEMAKRGYVHKSPISGCDLKMLRSYGKAGRVSLDQSVSDLVDRCEGCKRLILREEKETTL